MKAIICTKYGPPEVLQMKEMDKPVPKKNEILVKVLATTVSAADQRIRSFTVPLSFWILAKLALGFSKPRKSVLGIDFAGEVEAIGKDVKTYKPGDSIFGLLGDRFGGYAQYLCLQEGKKKLGVASKPRNLSFEEAAAVPFGGVTALYFLRKANIQNGQKVLINGASGSVGGYSVQLAKYYGAEVTAVCSTENIEMVKSLGADTVIDYTREDFTKCGKIYDVIFDVAGKASISRCTKSLTKNGTLLHAVAAPATSLQMKWNSLMTGRKMVGGGPDPTPKDLIFIKDLIESGKIKPLIDSIYPLEKIVEAHKHVEKGHKKGNVVIAVDHT